MILGENGEKMSKSRGNVVNPDDIVNEFGADTMRLYEMFIGDFEKAAPWNSASIKGCKRFLDRVWALLDICREGGVREEIESAFHKTIRKVTEDIENLKMNTAIAAMMALLNDIAATGFVTKEELRILIELLNPFAPHITEEMWVQLGFEGMLNQTSWPEYDEAKCVDSTVEIAVQICGKVRAKLNIAVTASADEVISLAKQEETIAKLLSGKTIIKEIYVPGKLVNIVAK
jgi:leucyl-tRNA synthetase